MQESRQLELLGTSGCHLCDIAEKMVRRIVPVLGGSVRIVDIAESDELVDQYGMSIPVLRDNSGNTLCWPFEEQQLIHWVESL